MFRIIVYSEFTVHHIVEAGILFIDLGLVQTMIDYLILKYRTLEPGARLRVMTVLVATLFRLLVGNRHFGDL